jgi:hypothetical protein
MQIRPKKRILVALCGVTLAAGSASAAVIYNPGDLLLGFHTAAGQGSGSSYIFNLGPAHEYRDNPTKLVTSSDLSVDLTATFGANWFSRTDLFWGIAAVRDPSGSGGNTVVNGDPKAAIYISKDTQTPGGSAPWNLAASSATNSAETISVATSINTMQGGFAGKTETATSGGRGTVQNEDTTINSWDEFNPIPSGAAFGGFLTGGVQAPLGGGAVESLDLYRLLGRTATTATPNTAPGAGSYVTTFTINSSGIVTTAVPEPTSALLLGLGIAATALRRRRNA